MLMMMMMMMVVVVVVVVLMMMMMMMMMIIIIIENIEKVFKSANVTEIQKICMFGSARILRKMLTI